MPGRSGEEVRVRLELAVLRQVDEGDALFEQVPHLCGRPPLQAQGCRPASSLCFTMTDGRRIAGAWSLPVDGSPF